MITFNGTEVEAINFNGVAVDKVTFQGVTVWEAGQSLAGTTWKIAANHSWSGTLRTPYNVNCNISTSQADLSGVNFSTIVLDAGVSVYAVTGNGQNAIVGVADAQFTGSTSLFMDADYADKFGIQLNKTYDRYITFNGGEDISNPQLILWLQANATEV